MYANYNSVCLYKTKKKIWLSLTAYNLTSTDSLK